MLLAIKAAMPRAIINGTLISNLLLRKSISRYVHELIAESLTRDVGLKMFYMILINSSIFFKDIKFKTSFAVSL